MSPTSCPAATKLLLGRDPTAERIYSRGVITHGDGAEVAQSRSGNALLENHIGRGDVFTWGSTEDKGILGASARVGRRLQRPHFARGQRVRHWGRQRAEAWHQSLVRWQGSAGFLERGRRITTQRHNKWHAGCDDAAQSAGEELHIQDCPTRDALPCGTGAVRPSGTEDE